MTSSSLSSKTAVVTGAGSGIGRATALILAARGARVVLADIDDQAGRESSELIVQAGGEAVFVRTDVADFDACAKLMDTAVEKYGHLDIAFNNAGIIDSPPAKTAAMTRSAWDRTLAINLTGVFNCMHHELNRMTGRGGSIINTSSIMGLKGTPGGAAYCASKHGVIGLTRAAALEYGRDGIRVNAICPGYIETPMTVGPNAVFNTEHLENMRREAALRRIADPSEVAQLVAWLASDQASFVTGAVYPVDGGVSAG